MCVYIYIYILVADHLQHFLAPSKTFCGLLFLSTWGRGCVVCPLGTRRGPVSFYWGLCGAHYGCLIVPLDARRRRLWFLKKACVAPWEFPGNSLGRASLGHDIITKHIKTIGCLKHESFVATPWVSLGAAPGGARSI